MHFSKILSAVLHRRSVFVLFLSDPLPAYTQAPAFLSPHSLCFLSCLHLALSQYAQHQRRETAFSTATDSRWFLAPGGIPPRVNYLFVPAWIRLNGSDPQPANGYSQAGPRLADLWVQTPTCAPPAGSQPKNVPLTVTGSPWRVTEQPDLGCSVGVLYEAEQLFCALAAGAGFSEEIIITQK